MIPARQCGAAAASWLDAGRAAPQNCARMRISCPSCSAEYDVPDQALAAGPRMLRCARCGHSFRAALPEAPAAGIAAESSPESQPASAAEAPAETPAPEDEPTLTPAPPAGAAAQDRLGDAPASAPDRMAVAGWVVTALVLLIAAYASFAWRADIMAAWPPSQRLYALLGLA